jgi:hypothetical protein
VIAEKQVIDYLLKIDIGDEHRGAGRLHLPQGIGFQQRLVPSKLLLVLNMST